MSPLSHAYLGPFPELVFGPGQLPGARWFWERFPAADPPTPFPDGYNPAGDAASAVLDLLGYLAWGATAAGVAGVIVVGMQLALQLRRGEPGEGAMYFRGLLYVLLACLIASTAGPIVEFLGPLGLQ